MCPVVLTMTAIRSLFKSLCVAMVLSAAAVSCLPISASADEKLPPPGSKEWNNRKAAAVKSWVVKEYKDVGKVIQIMKRVDSPMEYVEAEKKVKAILAQYEPIYPYYRSSNSASGSVKWNGFDITLSDLKAIHEKQAGKRLATYKKYMKALYGFYNNNWGTHSGSLRTDLYHFRKIVAWHQEEATKKVDAKNGYYRSAYFSN